MITSHDVESIQCASSISSRECGVPDKMEQKLRGHGRTRRRVHLASDLVWAIGSGRMSHSNGQRVATLGALVSDVNTVSAKPSRPRRDAGAGDASTERQT